LSSLSIFINIMLL